MISPEVRPVIEEVLDPGEIDVMLGKLIEPVIFDLLDFEVAVAGKLREPSDGVTFFDPKLEPRKLISFFDIATFPNKPLPALPAPETLFMGSRKSITIGVA